VTPIRVVLATMPPLLGDIVRATLARDPDVEILAEVASHDAIAPAVDRSDADVAILGVSPGEWSGLSHVLRETLAAHPRLIIIALASDGRSGYVYRMQPRGVVINDITPRSLVQVIHANVDGDVHPIVHPFSAE
jgi:two-component system, NarL family, response regulator DesR